MDFQEELNKLKLHYKAFTNRELAEKMGLSDATIKQWSRKKKIPEKYKNILKSTFSEINKNQNNATNGNIIQGHINNINIQGSYSHKVCEEIQKLSEKKQEYFYNLIRAEVLKNEM